MIHYLRIPGYFGGDQRALYDDLLQWLPDGARFVEIGNFKGRSLCYFLQAMQASGKRFEVHAVDHFRGSAEHQELLEGADMYPEFMRNMERAGVADLIAGVHRVPSLEAVSDFQDGSCDAIFVDGSHDYASVRDDIAAWRPKLVDRGLLAGDDWALGWPGIVAAVHLGLKNYVISGRIWRWRNLPGNQ